MIASGDVPPNRAPIRVFHLITGTGLGGAETMLLKLLTSLDRDQFTNIVYSMMPPDAMAARIRAAGTEVESLGMTRGRAHPAAFSRLAHAIRAWRPDVVQTWMYHADFLGGVVGRCIAGIPVVWNIRHGDLRSGGNGWSTMLVARACATLSGWIPHMIVCCADSARLSHIGLGYRASKMVLIPNGFDLDLFRPRFDAAEACENRFRIPRESQVVSLFARFHPHKGHNTFIGAARMCSSTFPNLTFALAGEGITNENMELSAALDQAGLRHRTRLLGRCGPEEVALLMSRSSIVANSSSVEGFSNTVGEAMACGSICVATDVGDSAYIIGDAGFIVPAGNPERMATAWGQVLRMSPSEKASLGSAARRRIETYFGISAIASSYARLYREIAIASKDGSPYTAVKS